MNISSVVRIIVRSIAPWALQSEGERRKNSVVYNRRALYLLPVSLFLMAFCLVFLVDAVKRASVVNLAGSVVLLGLLLISFILCILYYFNCRIYYGDQSFTVSNLIGKKRTYHYEDIEKILQGSQVWEIHLKSGTVRLRTVMAGCHSFLSYAKERKDFVVSPKFKKDIFNNNLKDPGSFVALFWVVVGVWIAAIFCGAIFGFPKDYSALREESVFFENYEITKSLSNDMILYSSDASVPYRIFGYDKKIEDVDAFLKEIDPSSEFRIQCVEKKDYYEIIAIGAEEEFISIDSGRQFELHRYLLMLILLISLLFVILIAFGIAFHIGRNANRYSDRVVRLFFKEGTIKTRE